MFLETKLLVALPIPPRFQTMDFRHVVHQSTS